MHPAIHSALTDARETELRGTRHHERPARKAGRKRRLAAIVAAASVVVGGAVIVSESSAALPVTSAAPHALVRFDGPRIAQAGGFGWQARCPVTNPAAR
jgi:hypothetical protein